MKVIKTANYQLGISSLFVIVIKYLLLLLSTLIWYKCKKLNSIKEVN